MPATTDDEDVVVPLRLQPVIDRPNGWRGRSVTFVAVGLAGFVAMALILGRSVDIGSRPPVAVIASASPARTDRPSSQPTPTPLPLADPLPTIEVTGSRIPTERRLVFANGLQVLDLATGTLEPATKPLFDQMLPIGDDQLVCACTLSGIPGGATTVPASLRFGRYRFDGTAILERALVAFDDVVPVPEMDNGVSVTTALSPDRTTLYALVAARRPPWWTIDMYEIRVATGQIEGHASLGRLPVDGDTPASPSPFPSAAGSAPGGPPPDGSYVWASGLSVSTNGSTLFATIADQDIRQGVWTTHNREWMVPLRGGQPGRAIRIRTADALAPNDWCISAPRFVDPDLLVQACAATTNQGVATTYFLRRLAADGTSLGDLPFTGFPVDQQFPMTAIVDGAARAVVIWDPVRHTLGRIDIDDGSVAVSSVPDRLLPQAERALVEGGFGQSPGLVESPDGNRLYALGMLPGAGRAARSSGIWVFDARTLQWLDHWAPKALLTSLAVSADGTFVYAVGANGYDIDGIERFWPASVTVYDAITGDIQVLYGAVSPDAWISFPVWP